MSTQFLGVEAVKAREFMDVTEDITYALGVQLQCISKRLHDNCGAMTAVAVRESSGYRANAVRTG